VGAPSLREPGSGFIFLFSQNDDQHTVMGPELQSRGDRTPPDDPPYCLSLEG
jgi:hypothetical protein